MAAAVKGAAAIECLHSAALIQDDIMDAATKRRGADALHTRLGNETALMLADYLIGAALSLLAGRCADLAPEAQVRAVATIAQCIKTSTLGQLAEASPISYFDHNAETVYLTSVEQKTGAVFAAAATIGPILSNCREKDVQSLAAYGVAVGCAFQLHDDVLDLLGDPQKLGKPVHNSLDRGRLLLPLIYLAGRGTDEARAALRCYCDSGEGWTLLLKYLDSQRIWDAVEAAKRRFVDAALNHIAPFPRNCGTVALESIAIASINRDD
jgi:geranylgeranyl pyrophosphate synthase